MRTLTKEELLLVSGGSCSGDICVYPPDDWWWEDLFDGDYDDPGNGGSSGDVGGGSDSPPPPAEEPPCDDGTLPSDDPDVDPSYKQNFEDHLAQLKERLGKIDPDSVFNGQVTIDGQTYDVTFSAGEFLEILDDYQFVWSDSQSTTNGAGGSFDNFAVVDPDILDLINSPTIQGETINKVIADWLSVHEVSHQLRSVETLTNNLYQKWAAANASSLAGLSPEQITEQWQATGTFAQLESMTNTVGRAILAKSGTSSFWSSPGNGYNATLSFTVTIQEGAGQQAGADQANQCGDGSGSSSGDGNSTGGGSYGGGYDPNVNLH